MAWLGRPLPRPLVGVVVAALIPATSATAAAASTTSVDHSRHQVFLVTVLALSCMVAMTTIVLSVELVRHGRSKVGRRTDEARHGGAPDEANRSPHESLSEE